MTAPTSYAQLAQVLSGLGALPVRQRGSHVMWQLPTGHVFPVPFNRAAWRDHRRALNRWTELKRLAPQLRNAA